MDDVTPQNLSNLQNVAREYISSISAEFDKICVDLYARVKEAICLVSGNELHRASISIVRSG